jgi:hypothetical protein
MLSTLGSFSNDNKKVKTISFGGLVSYLKFECNLLVFCDSGFELPVLHHLDASEVLQS